MQIEPFYSSLSILLVTIVLVVLLRVFFRKNTFFRVDPLLANVLLLVVGFTGLLSVVFALPISDDSKQVIVSAGGIVVGAAVALSSTTFISNGMSGIMLRLIEPFNVGDYIRTDGMFGRVSGKNLLSTEIQSVDRDIITIPNLKLISNPLTTILSSGTIISTTVSLGYDIPRERIEKALLEAAGKAGLEDPFVHVLELGNFSVTYKVGGLLKDLGSLLTDKSNFNKAVMDSLHAGGIEIVSPTFMNQRVFPEKHSFIPPAGKKPEIHAPEEEYLIKKNPEDIIFDRAIEAEVMERAQNALDYFEDHIKELDKKISTLPEDTGPDKQQVSESMKERAAEIRRVLEAVRETQETENPDRPEGLIRLKALEHLGTIVDSMYAEFKTFCDDVEKLSCKLEEAENTASGEKQSGGEGEDR
jgi:small-conductance mechanosensitive channel